VKKCNALVIKVQNHSHAALECGFYRGTHPISKDQDVELIETMSMDSMATRCMLVDYDFDAATKNDPIAVVLRRFYSADYICEPCVAMDFAKLPEKDPMDPLSVVMIKNKRWSLWGNNTIRLRTEDYLNRGLSFSLDTSIYDDFINAQASQASQTARDE
jgi:hypothetical protein